MRFNEGKVIFRNSAFVLALSFAAYAQAPVLITQPIDDSRLFTLAGNTRPEASAANDQGRVPDNMLIEHMLLQLRRSPEQEAAVEKLIDQLHDPKSPNYHQWLAADQFGQRFGLAPQDLKAITGWLQSHGFAVNTAYSNGTLLDFSGTAGQIREAFHTEIHNLTVNGAPHIANMGDPQIPAALAPAVAGIVSLHNFWPQPMFKPRANYTWLDGTSEEYAVVPGDLAVIYNLTPLQKAGKTGQGQTVVVIEDSNLYKASDFTDFRTTFGLTRFTSGKLTTVHPPSSGTNNCTNPGVNGDSNEAAIDAEYASAAAPNATIELASCADTSTTFGGLLAIENLLTAKSTPAIMSMSYGECEALNGAASNAAFNSAFQQAVALGVSVFVSAGDDGAASCDRFTTAATHGIGITGWGGTPYNVAVGGTDFGDSYAGTNTTYWNATNTQYYESAKSYVPEIPWNDSCASVLISTIEGYAATYGSTGFCNSSFGKEYFLTTVSGGGGPSGCATGVPASSGIVGGTCAGYPKPSWQTGVVGLPANSVRNIPDVSLFAANGIWGHYYPFCYSDAGNGGAPCSGAPDTWPGAGGTSFSSPIMAGIQAIVNQENGGRQGNPNVVYYQLAANQYGASGDPACSSTLGNAAASTCIFYDVTQGDNDLNCTGNHACYLPSGTNGVLSSQDKSYKPDFSTTVGWDFATGIGTVNANNLVTNWKTVAP